MLRTHSHHHVNVLACSSCNTDILYKNRSLSSCLSDTLEFGIASCRCSIYPIVCGILVYKTDGLRQICKLIKKQNYLRALSLLIDENRLVKAWMITVLFILYFKKLTAHIPLLKALNGISFSTVTYVIWLLSKNRPWWKYVANRNRIPAYYLSLLTAGFINKNTGTLLDLGCGAGGLLHWIVKHNTKILGIGVDRSFIALLIAKIFDPTSNIILINSFAENLPIQRGRIDLLTINDTWQYIPKTPLLQTCIMQCCSNISTALLFHIFSPDAEYTHQSIFPPVIPEEVVLWFKKCGFSYISPLSNKKILHDLLNNNSIQLTPEPIPIVNSALSYSLIASKQKIPTAIKPPQHMHALIRKEKINYYQDKELLARISLDSIATYHNYIFLSPHLDDAILSAGSLIQLLANLHKKITIVTIFTGANNKPLSTVAKQYLNSCGYTDSIKLFSTKKHEDDVVCRKLHIKNLHLGYTDAAWRKIPNDNPVYTTPAEQFSGHINSMDKKLVQQISNKLNNIIDSKNSTLLLTSLGIGGHVDHHIAKQVATALNISTLYWEDFPYNQMINNTRIRLPDATFSFQINTYLSKKQKLIRLYASQLHSLFPNNIIPKAPEKYFEINTSSVCRH